MIQLRPDQLQLKADIYGAWNQGARNVAAILPTGGGKSVVMSDIILDYHNIGATQTIIAHRKELVGQMSLHVARRGIKHRIIAPRNVIAEITNEHRREFGRSYINPDANCSVGGIDTIVSRAEQLKAWAATVDQFYIDEGHHALARNKWGTGAGFFVNARGLLVTASPARADGMGLGKHHDGIIDAMVLGPDMRTLINLGALCDYEIAIPKGDFHIDDDAIGPSGDFSQSKMHEASKKSHLVGDVVEEYIKRAYGKRGICFAIDVEDAQDIAKKFNERGIPAAAVSAETPSDVRAEYIRRFRDGRLWLLVNVDLFGEGFDVPAVEVVIMARPTASLAVYLQQFGRALRTLSGKLYGLVIDHVSNYKRHGLPDKPHYWSLDRRDKRAKKEKDPEQIELIPCSECSRPYERCLPACKWCGHVPPLPEPGIGGRTITQVDGDLMLLDREALDKLRASILLPSPADVANRAAHVAGAAAGAGAANRSIERHGAQQRLRAAIEQWAGCEVAKGRTLQEAYKRFYLTINSDVYTVQTLPRAEMDALASKVEGWYL